MDIDSKEELEKLKKFTFYISGKCPRELLNCDGIKDCNEDTNIENCVLCWRSALTKRIEQLSK